MSRLRGAVSGLHPLSTMHLVSNLRYALRSLRRRPAYAAMAVGILALGIGSSTAIFSIVDTVLLRSLPYEDPATIAVVFADGSARGQSNRLGTTAADFLDWREQTDAFSGLAVLRNESRRITTVEAPVVPLVHAVTANYFDVLGSRPILGRTFTPGEDAPGKGDVVILAYGLWQSVYGGDPGVVGRPIGLDGRPHTVIGIMGPDFYSAHVFAVQPGLWVPTSLAPLREDRTTRDLLAYGRLAPGRSLASAQAAMTTLAGRLAAERPETNDRWGVSLLPLPDHALGPFRRTGGLLLAAVALVLLIACANVANLALARSTEQFRDVAVRTALGASRGRIVGQLLTESLVLSLTGGVLGAALAWTVATPLARLIPPQAGVPFLDQVALDGRVLAFALVLSVVSGVVFGLLPSRQSTRLDLVRVLREGGRGSLSAPARRLRESLVVAEIALAVVVATGAALLLRSVAGLASVPPGYAADRVLKLRTSVRGDDFREPASRIAYFDEMKRRLEAVPGVSSVSATSFEPPILPGVFGAVRLVLPGASETEAASPSAVSRVVMPDFFETMGIPIRAGRGVTRDDGAGARRVAVISETMAERYFAGRDPVGETFSVHGPRPQPLEVVGVVGDIISGGTDPTPVPTFYTPYAQSPLAVMSFVLRVPDGDTQAPSRDAERAAWSLSPDVNVFAIETLDRRLAEINWRTRFGALMLAVFAGLALVLGSAGIYAVVSYTVFQRRGEIGLRMALGARASQVLAMVLKGGLRLALLGIASGVAVSFLVTRALAGFLYGVAPGDPATLAAVALVLVAVAAAASLPPAIRASRVDPQIALRE